MLRVFRGCLEASILIPLIAFGVVRAEEFKSIPGCHYDPVDWADGDSFHVKMPNGKKEVFRLYFVDCIEKDVADVTGKRRLREQARYFGVEDFATALDFGKEAADFTATALVEPFTVHTAYANAMGRSGKPRYYAFITTFDGKDLARQLVENGLARAFGVGRETPDGISRDDHESALADLELVAALRGKGVWKHCDPEKIVAMREAEREEMRALEAVDDALTSTPPDSPIDVNSAPLEDLVRAGFRESIADAIIKKRPFKSVDELDDVPGIGPATLAKTRPYLRIGAAVPARND